MIEIFLYNRKFHPVFLLILFSTAILVNSSMADSGYITDQLVVALKDRSEIPNRTVARVQTGDKVEIINKQENFYLVRTADGQEGWMKKQYLLFDLPKKTRIQSLQAENEALHRELEELRQTSVADNDHTPGIEHTEELNLLRTQSKQNEDTIIELKNNRNQLTEKVTELRAHLDTMKQDEAESDQDLDPKILWLLTGAFILLIGIFIGKLEKNKKKARLSF